MDRVPRELVVSVAACTYLVAVELLRREITFTLDRVQVAAMTLLPAILSSVASVVPEVLKEHFSSILV